MITKLYIKNFQAHEDSYLEFHPGVNVITGENDKGKSSVVRFIRWMAMNRPLGDSIIRDGQTEVEGTMVVMNDGQEIPVTRIRNKTKNVYKIDVPEEATFEAFGSDPPEHIRSIFQLDDLNYQDQFDPYFLVTQSPGQVATFIRLHTDLDIIDRAISSSTSKLREIKNKHEQAEVEKEKIQLILDALDKLQLNQFRKLLDEATEENQLIDFFSGKGQELSSLLLRNDQCEAQLARYSPNIELSYEKANELLACFSQIQSQQRTLIETTNRLNQIEASRIDLHALNALITLVEEIQTFNKEHIEVQIKPLITILSNWDRLIIPQRAVTTEEITSLSERAYPLSVKFVTFPDLIRKLDQNINNHIGLDMHLCDLELCIKQEEENRDVLLTQVVSCPSCGQKLTGKGREHLLEHCV